MVDAVKYGPTIPQERYTLTAEMHVFIFRIKVVFG